MMQTPMPPPVPGLEPNLVFNEVVPIIAAVVIILALAVALRGLFRSPGGEAIAERIRTRVQRRGGVGGDGPPRAAEVAAQGSLLHGHGSEHSQRSNFPP